MWRPAHPRFTPFRASPPTSPTIIVNGRYLTNPSMVDAANPGIPRQQLTAATLQVLDALVAQSRK